MSPEPTLTILEKHGFHLCTEPVSITTIVSAICTNTNLVDSVIVAKRINPEVASENTHCCVGYRDAVVRVSMPRRLESHHGEEAKNLAAFAADTFSPGLAARTEDLDLATIRWVLRFALRPVRRIRPPYVFAIKFEL